MDKNNRNVGRVTYKHLYQTKMQNGDNLIQNKQGDFTFCLWYTKTDYFL